MFCLYCWYIWAYINGIWGLVWRHIWFILLVYLGIYQWHMRPSLKAYLVYVLVYLGIYQWYMGPSLMAYLVYVLVYLDIYQWHIGPSLMAYWIYIAGISWYISVAYLNLCWWYIGPTFTTDNIFKTRPCHYRLHFHPSVTQLYFERFIWT